LFCADQWPMIDIVTRAQVELEQKGEFIFRVLNPDLGRGCHDGEKIILQETNYYHRSFSTWLNLAESLNCRLMCPVPLDKDFVQMTLRPLDIHSNWHCESASGEEKYGQASLYSRVDKREDPYWLRDYREALGVAQLKAGQSLLSLGVNRGDELGVLSDWFPEIEPELVCYGLDHSPSVIEHARSRFSPSRYYFDCVDITQPWTRNLQCDVLISLATLQSAQFDGYAVFRHWFQHHLKPTGTVILGFPNCRYSDGQLVYGAKTKNFRRPELSLLLKDLSYFKKYLQSHKKKVSITGKYSIFLTASPV
jgi:trans-aconitate methyltransferase